jgi:hypothetical protein
MAHEYHVELSDGKNYTVTTNHHHDDHELDVFLNHLLDIIKGTVSGVLSNVIVRRFTYRGQR